MTTNDIEDDVIYRVTDDDLPAIFSERPPNPVTRAQARILTTATEMNIPISFAEISKFGLLLIAILEGEERREL